MVAPTLRHARSQVIVSSRSPTDKTWPCCAPIRLSWSNFSHSTATHAPHPIRPRSSLLVLSGGPMFTSTSTRHGVSLTVAAAECSSHCVGLGYSDTPSECLGAGKLRRGCRSSKIYLPFQLKESQETFSIYTCLARGYGRGTGKGHNRLMAFPNRQ